MSNLSTVALITTEICSFKEHEHDFQLQFNKSMYDKASQNMYTKFNDSSSHNSRDLLYYKDKQK